MTIEFPLRLSEGATQYPEAKSACCVCDRPVGEVEGFIRMTVGATLFDDETRMNGGPSKLMDALFDFWFHGPHPVQGIASDGQLVIDMNNAECHLCVIDGVRGGQVDVLFCSTRCVRQFFDSAIKEFERKAILARRENEQSGSPGE